MAPIFDRSTIPLTVTKEGAYYIKSIEEILFIQRNMQAYFKDLRELNTGSLSIGGASFFWFLCLSGSDWPFQGEVSQCDN